MQVQNYTFEKQFHDSSIEKKKANKNHFFEAKMSIKMLQNACFVRHKNKVKVCKC